MVNPSFVDPEIKKKIDPVSEEPTDRGIRRVEAMASEDPQEMVADLFERYHAAIFAYLYRLLGDRESANDLRELPVRFGRSTLSFGLLPAEQRCAKLSTLWRDQPPRLSIGLRWFSSPFSC